MRSRWCTRRSTNPLLLRFSPEHFDPAAALPEVDLAISKDDGLVIVTAGDLGRQTAIQMQLHAFAGRLAGPDVCRGAVRSGNAFDQHLHPAPARLPAEDARRDDPGIVEHQQVAGLEQLRQFAELPVSQCIVNGIEAEQAAGAARRARLAGDQFLREIVVKVAALHGGAW